MGEATVTREEFDLVAKNVLAAQDAVKDLAAKSESRQKELLTQAETLVKDAMKAQEPINRAKILGNLANDYSRSGASLMQRALTDRGPDARARRGEVLPAADSAVLEFQRLWDSVLFIAACKNVPGRLTEANLREAVCFNGDNNPSPAGQRLWAAFTSTRDEFARAMATDVEFAGWVPTVFSPRMLNRYTLALKLAGLFEPIDMPHSPYQFPVQWARRSLANSYYGEQTASGTPSTWITAVDQTGLYLTLTAKKCTDFRIVSDEATVESIMAAIPILENDIADFHAWAKEQTLINGDATSSTNHMDSNITRASDIRGQMDGMRRLFLAASCKTDCATNPYTTGVLRGLRTNMGVWGVTPQDTAYVMGVKAYVKALSIAECLTADKIGIAAATWLTGQLASLDGSAVIVSEAMPENLNASGVYDGSTTSKHCYMLVNKRMFVVGNRMGITTKWFDMPYFAAQGLVSHTRFTFAPYQTMSTTNSYGWIGYNIAN